jgi:hypothetical protein
VPSRACISKGRKLLDIAIKVNQQWGDLENEEIRQQLLNY